MIRSRLVSFILFLAFTLPCTATATGPDATLSDRYEAALSIDPDNMTLRYFLGIAYLLQGEDRKAITQFKKAYPVMAGSEEINYNLGLAYSRSGDPDNALTYFEQAGELGAADMPEIYPLANAYFNLALQYRDKGKYTKAKQLVDRVLELDPDRAEARYALGEIAFKSGNLDQAVIEFQKYLGSYNQDPEIENFIFTHLYNRALGELESGDLIGARSSFLEAQKYTEQKREIDYFLGYIDYLENRVQDAIDRLTAVFPTVVGDIRDNSRTILYNIALSLMETAVAENLELAQKAMQPLVSVETPATEDLFLLGNIYLKRHEFLKAKDIYEAILNREPGHRGAILNLVASQKNAAKELVALGQSHYRSGDYPPAIEAFNEALRIDAADPYAAAYLKDTRKKIEVETLDQFTIAKTALAEERYNDALASIRRVLYLDPRYHRAKSLEHDILKAFASEINRLLEQIKTHISALELDSAGRVLNELLTMNPDHPEGSSLKEAIAGARQNRADLMAQEGEEALSKRDPLTALEHFRKALTLLDSHPGALDGLNRAETLRKGMFLDALRTARERKNASAYDDARRAYEAALVLDNDPAIRDEMDRMTSSLDNRVESLVAAAEALVPQKNWKKARDLYQQALLINPNHQQALNALADLERAIAAEISRLLSDADRRVTKGEPGSAVSSYRDVLDLEPANPQALSGLKRAKGMISSNIASLLTSGDQSISGGDYAAAERSFREVLSIDPYSAEAKEGLKRVKKAKLVGLKPGDEERLYLEGISLYTTGKYAEAIDVWEKVLLIAPGHTKASMNMEKARRKMEQLKERQNG